jgi:hypothetical protein
MSISQKVLCDKNHREVSRILNLPAPITPSEPARVIELDIAAAQVAAAANSNALAYAIALG